MVRSSQVSWLQAFEEYCRWISPISMSPRRIAEEHEFGGVRFMVGEVALPRLFARLPDLRLSTPHEAVRFGGWAFRGPLEASVRWDPTL